MSAVTHNWFDVDADWISALNLPFSFVPTNDPFSCPFFSPLVIVFAVHVKLLKSNQEESKIIR